MTEEPGKCEVCGAPATHFVNDFHTTYDRDGRRHLYVEGSHFFCSAHERPSQLFGLGPSVAEANRILGGEH